MEVESRISITCSYLVREPTGYAFTEVLPGKQAEIYFRTRYYFLRTF